MNLKQYFLYLDALREGGTINMFGAPQHLHETFGLSKEEAREIFFAWTQNLNEKS
tara:strand:- start:5600 stop:5764 length:165 start_codon:yes stop_codon:yes gene_type:complete